MHLCNGASGGKVMLGEVFQRFAEKSPIAVMVRGVLERVLSPEQLDEWYARTADKQYTRHLLFSSAYHSMTYRLKPVGCYWAKAQ
jgi:hypothetical protein